jgi:hypothetical protein
MKIKLEIEVYLSNSDEPKAFNITKRILKHVSKKYKLTSENIQIEDIKII